MSAIAATITDTKRGALALSDENLRLTWAELDALLNRVVNGFLALDLGSERRIAIFAPNSAEAVLGYLGCLLSGVSSVPANFHLTADELTYILQDSKANVLLVGPETADVGLAAAKKAGVPQVIGWRCEARSDLAHWDDMISRAAPSDPPSDMKPMPHLHYTSGTTGKPKATETPPSYFPPAPTVAAYAAIMRERAALLPGGPSLVVSPMYHTGPLTTVRAMIGGAAVVVLKGFDPERVLETIQRECIEGAVMVPTHFQRLLSLPDDVRAKYDVTSMKRLAHTGAACPRDVKKRMIAWFGPVLVEAYGGTESGTTTMINSEDWLKRPGSVGKAAAPFEAVIFSEDGKELPANEVGLLYFRDTTGRGIIYHGDPEKTAAAHIAPGVFTLGEMGYLDSEGYVFITDRVSDMVVSGGVNLYPAEVEHVLLQHDDVDDVAVVGVPNAEMGEELKALIVPRSIVNPPSAEVLNRFCRERLAGFKCPRSYEFLADIGRNAMGKVNKRELRRPYWPTDRTIGG
ncbi:long-chain-fatty-acid--CoA ligase [alpha proteobacterium U9-1i]|nr:long-chain-fatty-acid--CoA ligase [alpha proteobacterium U9-1i]